MFLRLEFLLFKTNQCHQIYLHQGRLGGQASQACQQQWGGAQQYEGGGEGDDDDYVLDSVI